ncbi:MAG: glycosyl transferase, partial [Clostridiales bacterium]|nr:glycosyl transferase [Clostridiales bacterium]
MGYRGEKAREVQLTAAELLAQKFSGKVEFKGGVSAQYVAFGTKPVVIGVTGLKFDSPLVSVMAGDDRLYNAFSTLAAKNKSVCIVAGEEPVIYVELDGEIEVLEAGDKILGAISELIKESELWGGRLTGSGELICDPSSPAPGPHYYTNMFLGNRIGFDRPLQSTPKSCVDRLGGGSFRAHADTQVLATRWDYLPEENGFPANRQFYLVENGKKIFWSGAAIAEGLESVRTVHSQNRTVITYDLDCGLKVKRTIFIVPQHEGLPLATEAQMIEIQNDGHDDKDLRIVATGMFGTRETHALSEDVIFTTVVQQSEVFYNEDGELRAVSFNPNPKWTKNNIRFATLIAHTDDGAVYPDEYCARYGDFVGSGSLENPEFIAPLACRASRKGPGFFALSAPFTVKAGGTVRVDSFTCLSSDAVNKDFVVEQTPAVEMEAVCDYYSDPAKLEADLEAVIDFTKQYASYMQIAGDDKDFSAYVNNNLPFQVFYQTFVSRSLDWTQKGYREIGFREIQDIYASMYYFAGMGKTSFIKEMLAGWI